MPEEFLEEDAHSSLSNVALALPQPDFLRLQPFQAPRMKSAELYSRPAATGTL